MMANVLFLSSDLMFTSRVTSAAKAQGVAISLVADQSELPQKIAADCRLALVDLSLDRLNLPAAVRAILRSLREVCRSLTMSNRQCFGSGSNR